MTLAWTTELLHRQKKLPDLETLMSNHQKQARPTRDALSALAQQYGLKLRPAKKGAKRGK